MLVFNCTKAAADFFTVTRKGEKISRLESAPHKTIAESIRTPVFPDDVEPEHNGGFQWQWVVHCVSIKRKKYMLVMDYHSRYCLMFPAGKKGDDIEFLNAFENQLKANFRYWVQEIDLTQEQATEYVAGYDSRVQTCAFYQRGDRSVQTHLNEVAWHLEGLYHHQGHITDRMDCMRFSVTASNIPRKCKGDKNYFYAYERYFAFWMKNFDLNAIENNDYLETDMSPDILPDNVIDLFSFQANKKK